MSSGKLFLIFLLPLVIESCDIQRKPILTKTDPAPVRDKSTPEKITSKNIEGLQVNADANQVKIQVSDNLNSDQKLLQKKYSIILHVPASEVKNLELYLLIDKWWGVKYKYGGNNESGIDCSGFSYMLLSTIYDVQLTRGSRSMYDETERVKKEDLQEGDLVFFKIKRGRVSHVGVYLMNNYFVHASVRSGVTISSLDDDYYRKVFCSGGRWKK